MSVAFIGGGNMATALAGGLVAGGTPASEIRIVEPLSAQRERLAARFPGIGLVERVGAAAAACDLVVLAVKPQQLRDALRPLLPLLSTSQPLILSIVAGIRLADIARWLGGYRRLVRAMPNTPALIGKGIAGVYAGPEVDAAGRELAGRVLAAGGDLLWVDSEARLDAVTGVSGSGPAYVFYFLEALEAAAVDAGFAAADARRLAYATFSGAVALAQSSDTPPAVLREQVTSKGGTTERALLALEADGVKDSIVAAVRAATARANEMADLLGRGD